MRDVVYRIQYKKIGIFLLFFGHADTIAFLRSNKKLYSNLVYKECKK